MPDAPVVIAVAAVMVALVPFCLGTFEERVRACLDMRHFRLKCATLPVLIIGL